MKYKVCPSCNIIYKDTAKKCPTCDGQLITFEAPIRLNDYVQMRYTLNAIQKRKKALMALCAEL